MATHLAPLFSASKLALPSLARVGSNAAVLLNIASSEQYQKQEQNRTKNEEKPAGDSVAHQNGENHGEDQEDQVNRETGEIGGPRGPEPTRYGDWERNGRCSDF